MRGRLLRRTVVSIVLRFAMPAHLRLKIILDLRKAMKRLVREVCWNAVSSLARTEYDGAHHIWALWALLKAFGDSMGAVVSPLCVLFDPREMGRMMYTGTVKLTKCVPTVACILGVVLLSHEAGQKACTSPCNSVIRPARGLLAPCITLEGNPHCPPPSLPL